MRRPRELRQALLHNLLLQHGGLNLRTLRAGGANLAEELRSAASA
jgi:hypothetical protein